MTTRTKTCRRCKEDKALTEFGKNKNRLDGIHYYCKACVSVMNAENPRRQSDITVSKRLSLSEFYELIDFKAASDGVGGFHYRWTGTKHSAGQGRLTPMQRLAEAIGTAIPDRYTEKWCDDEYPWCINVDHITLHGDLPSVGIGEFSENIDDPRDIPMRIISSGNYDSTRLALAALDSDWDPSDAETDKFLHSKGYNAQGEPLK